MLSLIGLGLYDERDMSLRALEKAKKCDEFYIERYTSEWGGLEGLKKVLESKVEEVDRNDLEDKLSEILDEAEDKDICIFVPGDPLVATTHIEIFLQAKKRDIETDVVHSSSIYSAVAETGLQIYKFGKTTTVPFPKDNYKPVSPYRVIKKNKERELHTLTLLDIEKGKGMEVCDALSYLLQLEKEKGDGVLNPNERVVSLSIKGNKRYIAYDTIDAMLQRNFETPSVIIFPGELHEKEEEALELFNST